MATRDNVHPITDADLDVHRETAEFRLRNVGVRGTTYDLAAEVHKLPGGGGYLLTEQANRALHAVLRGVCLFYELHRLLLERAGPARPDFIGAYALFGMGALVARELPRPTGDDLASFDPASAQDDFFRVGAGADDDLKGVLGRYLLTLQQRGPSGALMIETVDDLVALTHDYFDAARAVMAAGSERFPADLLRHLEGHALRIGDLEIDGFSTSEDRPIARLSFEPVRPEHIVGNEHAKRAIMRYVERLAMYDPVRQFNPIQELGGLPRSSLLDGFPGTGKTSLFRMGMTRLQDLALALGLKFGVESIDPSIKDEYYGKTGKLLAQKFAVANDPSLVSLILFDDIDLLLVSRGDASSAGADKDVLNLTMQFLAGAFTRRVGNHQVYAATNEATATDSALRQRFEDRLAVDGPETADDYERLLAVKLARPLAHRLVRIDGEVPRVQLATSGHTTDSTNGAGVSRRRHRSWRDLGELCMELKAADPRFTGRPIENVSQVLLARSADFDIPPEWFEKPDAFFAQPYERRLDLLRELYVPITADMVAEELQRYAESERRYAADASKRTVERRVDEIVAEYAAREVAQARIPRPAEIGERHA